MGKTANTPTLPDVAVSALEHFIQQAVAEPAFVALPPAAPVPETVFVQVCLIPDMDVGTGTPPW